MTQECQLAPGVLYPYPQDRIPKKVWHTRRMHPAQVLEQVPDTSSAAGRYGAEHTCHGATFPQFGKVAQGST